MRSFLLFRNNRHWSNMHRASTALTADMGRLRKGLATLLDESQPVGKRLMKAILTAPGLGPATATAILLIAHPDRYGVWNGVSEKGLRKLGLWPAAPRGTGEGGKYEEINKVLHRLKDDLKLDLWSLDACWWGLMKPGQYPVG